MEIVSPGIEDGKTEVDRMIANIVKDQFVAWLNKGEYRTERVQQLLSLLKEHKFIG